MSLPVWASLTSETLTRPSITSNLFSLQQSCFRHDLESIMYQTKLRNSRFFIHLLNQKLVYANVYRNCSIRSLAIYSWKWHCTEKQRLQAPWATFSLVTSPSRELYLPCLQTPLNRSRSRLRNENPTGMVGISQSKVSFHSGVVCMLHTVSLCYIGERGRFQVLVVHCMLSRVFTASCCMECILCILMGDGIWHARKEILTHTRRWQWGIGRSILRKACFFLLDHFSSLCMARVRN